MSIVYLVVGWCKQMSPTGYPEEDGGIFGAYNSEDKAKEAAKVAEEVIIHENEIGTTDYIDMDMYIIPVEASITHSVFKDGKRVT